MNVPQDPVATETVPKTVIISLLRFSAALILIVLWPVLTFILPFAFDDPTPRGALGAALFTCLYVIYPLVFYFSGISYQAYLHEGQKLKAAAIASYPVCILLLFILLALGLESL